MLNECIHIPQKDDSSEHIAFNKSYTQLHISTEANLRVVVPVFALGLLIRLFQWDDLLYIETRVILTSVRHAPLISTTYVFQEMVML